MTQKIDLLHPVLLQALVDLGDPEKAVWKPLFNRRAPGRERLQHGLFPPEGIDRSQVTAAFTFEVDKLVSFQIRLLPGYFENVNHEEQTVFGYIAHDQIAEISKKTGMSVDGKLLWCAAR